tara:strand:+ start:310 stop:705 length:396 start_codon:yes stop_codon:yes gene_type:complete
MPGEDLPVALFLRDTKENLAGLYCNEALFSSDFSPSGRLDIQGNTRFGKQEPPFASTVPARTGRLPLAPLVVRAHGADEVEVTRRTMGATIAEQEATIEALKAKIVHQEKTIGLMRNLIISFCAFCQHKAG